MSKWENFACSTTACPAYLVHLAEHVLALLDAEQVDDDLVAVELFQQRDVVVEGGCRGLVAPRHLHLVGANLQPTNTSQVTGAAYRTAGATPLMGDVQYFVIRWRRHHVRES